MGAFIDRVGQKFGRLTVQSQAENSGGLVSWRCVCDCGGEKTVSGKLLAKGLTKSCGCLALENRQSRLKDLTGKTFEMLTVLERDPQRGATNATRWKCLCSCGNETTVTGGSLVSGGVKSCGCLLTVLRAKDLTGKVFSRLTVLERVVSLEVSRRRVMWKCLCSCGNSSVVDGDHLASGHTNSCGCYMLDAIKLANTKHGACDTVEYNTWRSMRARCYSPNSEDYPDYGGRGITICKEWLDNFPQFLLDMGERPNNTSIDRVDNNLGYSKENCRWSIPKDQARNRRNNVHMVVDGVTMLAVDAAAVLGIKQQMISKWHKKGVTDEAIVERCRAT